MKGGNKVKNGINNDYNKGTAGKLYLILIDKHNDIFWMKFESKFWFEICNYLNKCIKILNYPNILKILHHRYWVKYKYFMKKIDLMIKHSEMIKR